MRKGLVAPLLVVGFACGEGPPPSDYPSRAPASSEATGGRPIQKGFTGKPRPATAKLPPPPPPLLSEEARSAAEAKTPSPEELARAQEELGSLLAEFEQKAECLSAAERESLRDRIRERVVGHAREGRLTLVSAVELYRMYGYPNDPNLIDREHKGKVVVLSGTVVPHNIAEITDIYKIFREDPYAHDPLLLETEYDVTFVRCRLTAPLLQKLADWQEIHLAGILEGKAGSDVGLRQCVVL